MDVSCGPAPAARCYLRPRHVQRVVWVGMCVVHLQRPMHQITQEADKPACGEGAMEVFLGRQSRVA